MLILEVRPANSSISQLLQDEVHTVCVWKIYTVRVAWAWSCHNLHRCSLWVFLVVVWWLDLRHLRKWKFTQAKLTKTRQGNSSASFFRRKSLFCPLKQAFQIGTVTFVCVLFLFAVCWFSNKGMLVPNRILRKFPWWKQNRQFSPESALVTEHYS